MTRIRLFFLLLLVIGPMHMAEQMFTGVDEFYAIRSSLDGYYGLFAPEHADIASVLLITIVWTVISLMFYALLHQGTPTLLVMGLMGAFGAQEVHHVVEAIAKGAYDPGVVTCVPYAIAGGYLLAAVWREFRRGRHAADTSRMVAVQG